VGQARSFRHSGSHSSVASSKSKLEVEFEYGGRPFCEVVIKAQNYWSRAGWTWSCNAVSLWHFPLLFVLYCCTWVYLYLAFF